VLKITVLLGVAALLAVMLRRRSAATRHFVWLLALGGCMAVLVLPATPKRFTVETRYWPAPSSSAGGLAEVGPGDLPAVASTASARFLGGVADRARRVPLAGWLGLLWLAGSTLVAARCAIGWWRLGRLARAASPVRNPRWEFQLGQGARSLGVLSAVRVRASALVGSPLVCGIMRPIVLIPTEAEDWPEDRRRVVVLHELAHVARRDVASQLLGMMTCSIYWFHPGVWAAASHLRAESERACDDLVLGLGVGAADYAQHLLEVAKDA